MAARPIQQILETRNGEATSSVAEPWTTDSYPPATSREASVCSTSLGRDTQNSEKRGALSLLASPPPQGTMREFPGAAQESRAIFTQTQKATA